MFKFTRTGVNLISFLITILIFCLVQIFIYQYTNGIKMNVEIENDIMKKQEENISKKTEKQEIIPEETKIESKEEAKIWQIEIPTISLKADIAEGTEKETLSKKVGHFEETQKKEGNIGLAAHNRGYEVNYFQNLKLLKEGDEIKYKYNNFEKTYEVTKNKIIVDTDWTYLENTEENMITLITCVENEPNYRRCVQAVEKEP